jgi:hypothetical protein
MLLYQHGGTADRSQQHWLHSRWSLCAAIMHRIDALSHLKGVPIQFPLGQPAPARSLA